MIINDRNIIDLFNANNVVADVVKYSASKYLQVNNTLTDYYNILILPYKSNVTNNNIVAIIFNNPATARLTFKFSNGTKQIYSGLDTSTKIIFSAQKYLSITKLEIITRSAASGFLTFNTIVFDI